MRERESHEIWPRAVLGYRLFRVTRGLILPLGDEGRNPYSPGVNRAVCRRLAYTSGEDVMGATGGAGGLSPRAAHPAPDPECLCGIYAFHSPEQAREKRSELAGWGVGSSARARSLILAAVAGAGESFVYERGWRAEQVQILAFELSPGVKRSELGLSAEWNAIPWVSPHQTVSHAERLASSITL